MELTPGRRRLVFIVIVLALVGLVSYLIAARGSGGTSAAAPPTPASSTPAPASSASAAASVPPTALPSATPASTAGGAEIYQWLPFTATDLTAAANATTAFAKAYVTWSYTENATAYGTTFNGLANAQEITSIEEGYDAPGEVQQRTTDKQASTGSATIDQITSFGGGPASITFAVTISQQVTPAQPGTPNGSQQYSVTVVSSDGAWLVTGFELASVGNQ